MRFAIAPASLPLARITFAFFALTWVVFTCAYPFLAPVNNPNENVRTYETMAIVENHTFQINKIVERYGWVNDMAAVPELDGTRHLFSVKAPATSYFGVPVYWAMTKLAPRFGHVVPGDQATPKEKAWWFEATTFSLRLFSVQIPCFLFLVWLERWLRLTTADPVLRLSAVAATGMGTNYLAYALSFASHATFALAAFASFAIVTRERALHPFDPSKRRLSQAFWAGLLAGLATLLEYHALPVSVCLSIYALTAFWKPARLAMFALGGMLNAAALMWFQWRCFHNPFMPGHRMSENPRYAQMLQQGWFGIGKPDWEVFGNISFNLGYGFFGTSPFMWLGLLAIPFAIFAGFGTRREQAHRRTATIAWLLTMLVLWTTVSAAINWRGGWTVGPRYLGGAPPFFAYGAVCALEWIAGGSKMRRAVVRGVAGASALASVITIGLVGLHFNTIPEEIKRPLLEVTLPLARAGFVPHHALELFGVTSGWFWYVVAACALVATLVAALVPWRDSAGTWGVRAGTFVCVLVLAMQPALSEGELTERGDLGGLARRAFAGWWDPAGRERLPKLREEAERLGPRGPCAWIDVANTEKLEGMVNEAAVDAKRAGDTPPTCRSVGERFDAFLLRHSSVEDAPKDLAPLPRIVPLSHAGVPPRAPGHPQ